MALERNNETTPERTGSKLSGISLQKRVEGALIRRLGQCREVGFEPAEIGSDLDTKEGVDGILYFGGRGTIESHLFQVNIDITNQVGEALEEKRRVAERRNKRRVDPYDPFYVIIHFDNEEGLRIVNTSGRNPQNEDKITKEVLNRVLYEARNQDPKLAQNLTAIILRQE